MHIAHQRNPLSVLALYYAELCWSKVIAGRDIWVLAHGLPLTNKEWNGEYDSLRRNDNCNINRLNKTCRAVLLIKFITAIKNVIVCGNVRLYSKSPHEDYNYYYEHYCLQFLCSGPSVKDDEIAEILHCYRQVDNDLVGRDKSYFYDCLFRRTRCNTGYGNLRIMRRHERRLANCSIDREDIILCS
jgi:hypothetical protein